MRKLFSVAAATASMVLAPTSALQAREFVEIYTQCGLGALIAPNHDAVAAVTNVTWDLGTTAVSSNVSSADTCQGGKKKVASLIQNAYPQLTSDIAKGHGNNLDALVAAAQCDLNVGAQFKTEVRYGMGQLAAQGQNKTQQDKNEELFALVKSSATQVGCSI